MKKIFLISSMLFATFLTKAQISVEYNEFRSQTTYRTPHHYKAFGTLFPESVVGYIVKDSTESNAYISASLFCHSLANGRAKGIIIIFQDGTKLKFSEAEIDFNYNSTFQQFEASTFIPVDITTLQEFAEKEIKGISLYIYDRYVTPKESARVKQNFTSLLNQPNQ